MWQICHILQKMKRSDNLKDKYNMTVETNIFYAKRNIVDTLYKTANLEGIAVTFPETNEIYEGRNVAHLSVDDVVKINNLKNSWKFLFDTIDYPCDFRYIKQMNQLIQIGLHPLSGQLRTADVSIGGTSWKPEIPIEEKVIDKITEIMSIQNVTERAIDMMLYLMRAQLFYDGNKRTAQLVANQILIQNGKGILAIPVDKQMDFLGNLVSFYETNDNTKIKSFVYDNAIDGLDIPIQPTHETDMEV